MSDYLTRLAARALGQAEVVQPRLPSLFEAVPVAAREEHVVREAPRADAEPSPPGQDRAAYRRIEESERRGDEPEPRARVASNAPLSVDESPHSSVDAAARAASRPPEPDRPRDDASALRPGELEPADTLQQAARAPDRQDTTRPRREPEVAPPRARSRPAVVIERPARGEAPSVRVTIGRVEVRAIAPPPPRPVPARPQAPVPRLSLDEYVRLRDEGKR